MKSKTRTLLPILLLFLAYGGLNACKRHVHLSTSPKGEFSAQVRPSLASDIPEIGLAAYRGDIGTLQRLISSGANIESAGQDKRTPLVLAAAGNNYEAAAVLLDAGANVDVQDVGGLTALNWAAIKTNEKLTRLLLNHHAGVDIQNAAGGTALISAAEGGSKGIVEDLLNAGADPNLTDLDGHSARDWAMINGYPDIATLLKEKAGSAVPP